MTKIDVPFTLHDARFSNIEPDVSYTDDGRQEEEEAGTMARPNAGRGMHNIHVNVQVNVSHTNVASHTDRSFIFTHTFWISQTAPVPISPLDPSSPCPVLSCPVLAVLFLFPFPFSFPF